MQSLLKVVTAALAPQKREIWLQLYDDDNPYYNFIIVVLRGEPYYGDKSSFYISNKFKYFLTKNQNQALNFLENMQPSQQLIPFLDEESFLKQNPEGKDHLLFRLKKLTQRLQGA